MRCSCEVQVGCKLRCQAKRKKRGGGWPRERIGSRRMARAEWRGWKVGREGEGYRQSYREADHGVGQRRVGLRVLRPQPAVVVGARKGARDVGIRRLAQQPGARLAGHSVPTRVG